MKYTYTFLAIICIVSCTKENASRHSINNFESTEKTLTFSIGQHYGGGIIFYIDSTGQHGLIADTVDLPGYIVWWNGTSVVTKATGTAIGTGKANAHKIISIQGNPGKYAALKCHKYKGSGYTDWFLPSRDEFYEMYKHKNLISNFSTTDYYWSSSETSYASAWALDFSDDEWNNVTKGSNVRVRSVRTF